MRRKAEEARLSAEQEMRIAFKQRARMQEDMEREAEAWKRKLKEEQKARLDLEESKNRLEREFQDFKKKVEEE